MATDPAALVRAGLAHWRAGRMSGAITALSEAARRAPADCSVHIQLAGCLAAANRPDLAHPLWSRALALAPRSAEALCGRARAAQALARPAEAKLDFEAALAADPAGVDARFGLAELALETNDLEAAQAHLAVLDATHGESPAARWLGARVAFATGDFAGVETRLAPLADDARLPEPAKADAVLLRARALDRLGKTARAFHAAAEGKALQRRLLASRAAGRESETDRLNRLATWFENVGPAFWAATPRGRTSPAADHVFLLGFPRSGTTLLEQALAANRAVVTLEEAPTLSDAAQEFLSDPAGLDRLSRVSDRDADHWRAIYWRVVREHGVEPRARLFLDKAPAGIAWPPLIARLFPNALVLFALRDPRDVVLSCFMSPFQMNALTYAFTGLEETARCYAAAMRLAMVFERLSPNARRVVRYERIVDDFTAEISAICAFLGLAHDPAMAEFAAAARLRAVRTPSATQVREGLNRRGLGRWRAYEAELAPVLPMLAPWVEAFGYAAGGAG